MCDSLFLGMAARARLNAARFCAPVAPRWRFLARTVDEAMLQGPNQVEPPREAWPTEWRYVRSQLGFIHADALSVAEYSEGLRWAIIENRALLLLRGLDASRITFVNASYDSCTTTSCVFGSHYVHGDQS